MTYNRIPRRGTPIPVKEEIWARRVQMYKELTDREFPYHQKFKYFEESESRIKEAESVYIEIIDARQQARERERVKRSSGTCSLCGEPFRRKSINNIICSRCRWFFDRDTTTLLKELASGKCTKSKIKQLLKDKLEDLDEDTRNRINKGEFNFSTEVRTLTDISKERAEILENLEKHKIPEPRIVRCSTCGKLLTSQTDQKNGRCQTCIDRLIPPEERWFKGIVGLSDRSLEDIAKLPSYCQEVYTKHMSKEELEQFRIVLIPFKKQSTLRSVMQERNKFTIDNDDI